jgi:hypothetical protein
VIRRDRCPLLLALAEREWCDRASPSGLEVVRTSGLDHHDRVHRRATVFDELVCRWRPLPHRLRSGRVVGVALCAAEIVPSSDELSDGDGLLIATGKQAPCPAFGQERD